jgi:hypothetical protein
MDMKLYLSSFLKRDRLRVFENRLLKRMFGHKREEVTGSWRKLHAEFQNLYPHQITLE